MVGNSVASVTVTATVADDSATVSVNGLAVASGSPGDAIDLEAGENVITVEVTTGDGATTVTYTVTVTRATVVPALPLGGVFTARDPCWCVVLAAVAFCGMLPGVEPSRCSWRDGGSLHPVTVAPGVFAFRARLRA